MEKKKNSTWDCVAFLKCDILDLMIISQNQGENVVLK